MENSYYDPYTETKVKVTLNTKGDKPLADASVYLETKCFGFITIKKFKIWKSPRLNTRLNAPINITPPSISVKGKNNFLLVFFENLNNMESWKKIENIIYQAYWEVTRISESNTQTNNEDEKPLTNPEDIPF